MKRLDVLLLSTFATVTAAAGTARADKPAWCATPGVHPGSGMLRRALDDDPREALPEIVLMLCSPDGNAHLDEVEGARQKWNARLGLTDADWGDVAAWTVAGTGDSHAVKRPTRKAWSTLGPIEQYAEILASGSDTRGGDVHYLVDALGDRLSETGRLAYVQVCLKNKNPTFWAVCQPDLAALDPKKISAEVHADTAHSGPERMAVRVALDDTLRALPAHADVVKALEDKDATWGKVFEVAATARDAWAAHPPDGDMLAAAAAMDDARVTDSNKAYAGCEDTTWAAFGKAVAAIPATKFGALKPEPLDFMSSAAALVLGDRDGYLASIALVECVRAQPSPDAFVRLLGDGADRWPGFRGPRSAGLTAIQTADLKLDARSAKIRLPQLDRGWLGGSGSTRGGGRGVVAAVARGGATAEVSFAKKLRKEEVCSDWRDTDHVVGIEESGTLIYDYVCTKRSTITVNDAPAPRTVAARFLTGVKPGVTASILEDAVLAVWPAGAKQPSHVFGVAVK